MKNIQLLGEVPKWLKGLPWKGSRSLIPAQEFKSLHLRSSVRPGKLLKQAVSRVFIFFLALGFEWRDIKRGVISKHSIREVGITPLGASGSERTIKRFLTGKNSSNHLFTT